MSTYANSLAPEDCTVHDLIERAEPTQEDLQRTLSHYSDLWRQSEREKELASFFKSFEAADADHSQLAEEEDRIGVTPQEWADYLRTQAELANARYARSPF